MPDGKQDEQMANVNVTTSKTKSGKVARVAVIPEELVNTGGPERMHWLATDIAQENKCSHYRVVSESGQLLASGKAGAQPTQEQTARTHGDGSDWER